MSAGGFLHQVLVVGADHWSSPEPLRDRLALALADPTPLLTALREGGCEEALILATCDRIEVVCIDGLLPDPNERIAAAIARCTAVPLADLEPHLQSRRGESAVHHLFAVAASLESRVIGEPFVLGQLKESHTAARRSGAAATRLDALLDAAYCAAKRVRTETGIARKPASMASAAVDLARNLHGDLGRISGWLVGSGEMGYIIGQGLLAAGLRDLVVVDPAASRAEGVARALHCHSGAFDALAEDLARADILVSALGCRRHVLTGSAVRGALRRRRRQPMLLIDVAVPGDLDPAIDTLDQAFLYRLGDLEAVATAGRVSRQNEADAARRIVDEEVARFIAATAERAAVPALVQLREHFEQARRDALAAAGNDAEKATRLLVNRLLHGPAVALKRLAAEASGGNKELAATQRLLGLFFGSGTKGDEGGDKEGP